MLVEQGLDASVFGLLGLLIGSFLNVVIYRLPRMMEAQWKAECAELSGQPLSAELPKFNLMVPRSRCQQCGHQIRWFENIPVLSYFFLRGKCANCGTKISLRYPLVELTTGALFAYCAWTWGLSPTALAWSGFGACVLALGLIDWDTTLLPDDLTLPLLWAGLISAALRWTSVGLPAALWGAVAGYLSLWLIYWAFKLLTGKEGMGYGDFKLFAALGAWFGWQMLPAVILLSSVVGAVLGIGLMLFKGKNRDFAMPFGPFLALGGIAALFFGKQLMQFYMVV